MDRASLVDSLNRASAALADTDMLPVLTHFWFTGSTLMAYNDRIGISIPMKTDFKGAVLGKLLLDILKASSGESVDMMLGKDREGGDCIKVSTKRTNLQLGYLPASSFAKTFTMPEPNKDKRLPIQRLDLTRALEVCMKSVSSDTTVTDQLGVTLLPYAGLGAVTAGSLEFYATNSATLSFHVVPLKSKLAFERAILPSLFCQQLLDFLKDGSKEDIWLEVHPRYALFKGEKGELLWGNLIVSQNPIDFPDLRDGIFPEKLSNALIKIPNEMEAALDRACVLAATEIRTPKTSVSVKDGSMFLVTKANGNEVRDEIKLKGQHDKVSLSVNPKFLRSGLDSEAFRKGRFLMTSSAVIMVSDEDSEFYIAAGE